MNFRKTLCSFLIYKKYKILLLGDLTPLRGAASLPFERVAKGTAKVEARQTVGSTVLVV